MLRIAVQSKGRLNEDTMLLLQEAGIKLDNDKRKLLVPASNFPVEILFLRDDDIPQSVAMGVADVGVVGENEYVEKRENAVILKRLGFSKCRLSIAIPKSVDYPGVTWLNGKTIATSYPHILSQFLQDKGIQAEIHTITGSVEIAPGIGLADCIMDIVSSGGTLVTNQLKEVEVLRQSDALLIGHTRVDAEIQAVLAVLLFRIHAVQQAENKKYVLMNVPNEQIKAIVRNCPV
jgi:ATP phosphoribosyltransferase